MEEAVRLSEICQCVDFTRRKLAWIILLNYLQLNVSSHYHVIVSINMKYKTSDMKSSFLFRSRWKFWSSYMILLKTCLYLEPITVLLWILCNKLWLIIHFRIRLGRESSLSMTGLVSKTRLSWALVVVVKENRRSLHLIKKNYRGKISYFSKSARGVTDKLGFGEVRKFVVDVVASPTIRPLCKHFGLWIRGYHIFVKGWKGT